MTQETLLGPAELKEAKAVAHRVLTQLDRVLLGQQDLHHRMLIAILARGHVLLEGLPGLGKTEMVKALGNILELDFKRVQFTPDLMPSDIAGTHILQEQENGRREMVFQAGPVFTNLLLADEINRASPKTQAALLEAMQEHNVTLLGETRPLPKPFFVLASQNPVDLEGTYPLPEAQLDRFLFKLNVAAPSVETLSQIIGTRHRGTPPAIEDRVGPAALQTAFQAVDRIFIPAPICRYIAALVAAGNPKDPQSSRHIKDYVTFGPSPRAAIAIAESARAAALLRGSPTVGFEDVELVAPAALNHRLILNYKARIDGMDGQNVADHLVAQVDPTGAGLKDVTVST